jgi:uncharacterized protein YrrD
MQFREGAEVYTWDDKHVGNVDRVVIDPKTNQVTDIVVRKGLLFTEDKVVPLNLVSRSDKDQVILHQDAGDLQALPLFEETHYLPVNAAARAGYPSDYAAPLYWYPPLGMGWWGAPGALVEPPQVVTSGQNIREGTVALKEGARVMSADGEHVGDVERILTDVATDRVTHLLIARGLLVKEKKLVPMHWVNSIEEDEVLLGVNADILEDLREYSA